jgi:hypothetical protein
MRLSHEISTVIRWLKHLIELSAHTQTYLDGMRVKEKNRNWKTVTFHDQHRKSLKTIWTPKWYQNLFCFSKVSLRKLSNLNFQTSQNSSKKKKKTNQKELIWIKTIYSNQIMYFIHFNSSTFHNIIEKDITNKQKIWTPKNKKKTFHNERCRKDFVITYFFGSFLMKFEEYHILERMPHSRKNTTF